MKDQSQTKKSNKYTLADLRKLRFAGKIKVTNDRHRMQKRGKAWQRKHS